MPREVGPQKSQNPLEGAEALFGVKEGEFSASASKDSGILDFDKFDKEIDEEEQEQKIQRTLSHSVSERYEKMKREGFKIEPIKQYGVEFLSRMGVLRAKQEKDKLLPHEAKELYGAEAELNNAMDKFEDSREAAKKTIPEIAKSIAAVYARFMTDETKGEVRLKKTEIFARDIEKYIGGIRAGNYAEFQKCIEAVHHHGA